jgi:ABC-type transport system involved in multi-copper enzyme maturation permease subunit
MEAVSVSILLRYFSPLRLAGPLSDKELRVASRRAGNYALRAGYIVLLSILVLWAWYSTVGVWSPKTAAGASTASEVSASIAGTIIWFQFVAAQLVAAIMLSSSISDELRRGTLSTLMTTPIRSVHIIIGKLLSGLLQVVLLLAIGLPVLAILRVQGGVPWDFVVAGFCITLTAAVFSGALSLWVSTYYRQPCQAISAVAEAYFIFFLFLPIAMPVLAFLGAIGDTMGQIIIELTNPFWALVRVSMQLQQATAAGPGGFPWPIHCATLLGATLLILCLSVWRVRRAALGDFSARAEKTRPIDRLRGSPVVWKDTGGRLFPWGRADIVAAVTALGTCGLIVVGTMPGAPVNEIYLRYLSLSFWFLVLLRLVLSVAGGITREKESGAWPILLTTPLDSRRIVRAKAAAALRQNMIPLLSAFAVQGCLLLRTAGLSIGSYVLYSGLYMVASAFLIVSLGLYFGVRLRTTNLAAAATVGTYLCVTMMGRVFQNVFIRLAWPPAVRYGGPPRVLLLLNSIIFGCAIVLALALSGLLLWRACRNVRRYVF